MGIHAQIFEKNAQAEMLSFKIMLRLKSSDEKKCSEKNAQMKINAQIEMKKMLRWKRSAIK